MTDRELLQQALDALNNYVGVVKSELNEHSWDTKIVDAGKPARETIEAIRARLAQPEQIDEQGRSMTYWGGLSIKNDYERGFIDGMAKQTQSSVDKALNQKKEWVGLTAADLMELVAFTHMTMENALSVEAKLKEKNT